jgi:predicted DNA-binding transcriptional regulator YafY
MAKTKPQAVTRPPWERMMRFHQLVQEESFPNCNVLAKEFEVSWRTIMRDVDFMKCRLKLPLEFDAQQNGYYYTKPVDQFPQMPFTEAEVFAMLVAHKAIAQYCGTPFEHPLAIAFRKLTGQLDSSTKYSLGNLDEALSFRPFAPEDTDLESFEILTRALKERRVLKFQYRNLDADKHQPRLVHPYHLGCVDNHWYLFAFDVKRQAMRTFALPRLKSPEITSERFTIPKKFNLSEYLKGSLTVFKGDADYEIVVDFDSWGADLIRGRKWHASQEITELPKRQLRLRLRLNNIEEAERWVLSWGTHATVVRPQALATRLREIGRTLDERYKPEP